MSAADQTPAAVSGEGAAAGNPPVNYIDVKLHGIYNVPLGWLGESGPAPVFNDHIFRYEVDLTLAGAQHTFRNGRVLSTVTTYNEFVDQAKLPPAVGGTDDLDDVASAPDVPEPVTLKAAGIHPAGTAAQPQGPSETATADGSSVALAVSATHTAPAAILWVLGPEVDTEVRDDLGGAGKRDPKPAAKKGAPAPPVQVQEAVKVIPPSSAMPPACLCRFPLSLLQISALEDQLEKHPALTLTFRRVLRAGCPVEWEDSLEAKYQATITVPLKPLLEPGSTFMQATVPLEPSFMEAPKDDEKGGKGAGKKAAPKKTKGAAPACLTEELDPNEAHPYVSSQTHCVLSIRCHTAVTRLPQARPRPDLQPSDLIPRRLRPSRRPADATKQFSREVEGLVWRIVRDYRDHCAATATSGIGSDPATLRQSFLQYLQTSGKTHVYKDLLVPSVQAIVKETFIRKPSPSSEELDRVSSELYTYVLDQSHLTMSRSFIKASKTAGNVVAPGVGASLTAAPGNPDGSAPVERWRRLAVEAETMREYATAAKYHQECIVHSRGRDGDEQPDVWCDYAEFCLRVRDALKAEQAYREALAVDMGHARSLTGYGCLLLSRHRFMEAEVILQSVVTLQNDSLSWSFLAAYYDGLLLTVPDSPEEATRRANCRRESKLAMLQAVRLASQEAETPTHASSSSSSSAKPPQAALAAEDMYQRLADRLLDLRLEEVAGVCLARSRPSLAVDMMQARLLYQTTQYEEAAAALKTIVDAQPNNPNARLLLGDVYAAMNKAAEAEAQYDQALRTDPHCGTGPSLVRLGNMYIALGKFKDALSAFLLGAKVWPSGLTWLGVGISYYRMDDLTRAEQSLNEANILNNLNGRTWGYLALVCLRQRREEEGDMAFNQAIKQGLDDPYLTTEIGVEQFRLGRYKIAEACFRRSIALFDDCNTRMHLARTLAALRRLPEAREEFSYVARTTSSEAQRQRAEEQLQQLPVE